MSSSRRGKPKPHKDMSLLDRVFKAAEDGIYDDPLAEAILDVGLFVTIIVTVVAIVACVGGIGYGVASLILN